LLGEANSRDDSAWQVNPVHRPLWVADGMHGRPAIRFGGESYLITTPFATTDEVSIVLVFQYRPQQIEEGKSGQLINLNGPPNLVVERWWEGHLKGRHYGGWTIDQVTNRSHAIAGSLMRAAPLPDFRPVVCGMVYDHSADHSAIYLNGHQVVESRASEPTAVTSSKVIGCNHLDGKNRDYFAGDISEILVFNGPLTPSDIQTVSGYFLDRYGIELD
jgi:hypothetical protein